MWTPLYAGSLAIGVASIAIVGCGLATTDGYVAPTPFVAESAETPVLTEPVTPCVAAGRYTVSSGVVLDRQERLMWQRSVTERLVTRDEAARYCVELGEAGLAGWHLPDVHELNGLTLRPSGLGGAPDPCIPAIDQDAFPATPSAEFWSASVSPRGDGLFTDFADGRTHPSPPDVPMNVRCVRALSPAE